MRPGRVCCRPWSRSWDGTSIIMANKTGGGRGTNQYKVRGRTTKASPIVPSANLMGMAADASHQGAIPDLHARVLAAGVETQRKLAGDPTTPPGVLQTLVQVQDHEVDYQLALNDSTPPEALRTIKQRYQDTTYHRVIQPWRSRNAPGDVIAAEIDDHDRLSIYVDMVKHPNTTPETLAEITRRTLNNTQVLEQLASRVDLPEESMLAIADIKAVDRQHQGAVADVKKTLMANLMVTSRVIERLVRDEDSGIRSVALHHSECPAHIRAIARLAD